MRLFILLLCLVVLRANGCRKDDATDRPANTVPLPYTADFTTLPANHDTTSAFQFGGLSYGVAKVDGQVLLTWQDCGSAVRGRGSINAGIVIAPGYLIGDLSGIPSVNKITVRLFDNASTTTFVSACAAAASLAKMTSAQATGPNSSRVYTLNLGGRHVDKLVIGSAEAVVYSIAIE